MKIKQTIKRLILGIAILSSATLFALTPAYAATCGGVTTSVIGCKGTGACPGGEDPYEGSEPKAGVDPTDPTSAKSYLDKYHHNYGKCLNDATPSPTTLESSGVWSLLLMVINILTAGVGIVAVGGIIYGSIMYTTAEGSADKVSKARGIITNVVIGLIAYALMFSLLNFIIPGGLFT